MSAADRPLVSVTVTRSSESCPFSNRRLCFSLRPGQVLWLRGPSGAGKTFTCSHLAGLAELPGAELIAEWDERVPRAERLGILFQQGVLVDSLSLAANVALALRAARGA